MIPPEIYRQFLEEVIHDGMIAARSDYDPDKKASELEGSLQGFEACKGKTPEEIYELYLGANKQSLNAYREEIERGEYWRIRCRALEIEWVLNVVSALRHLFLEPPLIPVTARGMVKAIEVRGNILVALYDRSVKN